MMKISTIVIITFLLNGCGGTDSRDFNDIDSQMLEICDATDSNTLDIKKGDVIDKLTANTVVKVITTPDNSQRACTVSGSAVVLH